MSIRKKVLIITYYWPPSGGAGVQRWLKFSKYLREFGWEPVIYTPENGEVPVIDNSLSKDIPENLEVIKRPIWEPYGFYKKLVGRKKDDRINSGFLSEKKKKGVLEDLSVWIRGNWFIPDARKFWIKPSIRFLSDYLAQNPVDAIVSTGPPHSMHLIALGLKEKLNIPWVADFRDPWTNIDFYQDLKLTRRSDKKHRKLEHDVLSKSDCVIAVGNTLGEELSKLGARQIRVITNGYDTDDLILEGEVILTKEFSISHIGSMVPSRNPNLLWKVLSDLKSSSSDFAKDLSIKTVGKVDYTVLQSLEKHGLLENLEKVDYMPHGQLGAFQRSSQVLLLVINNTPNAKGILTGKFFEYMAAKRPIVAIGPADGDVATILKETKTGQIFDVNQEEDLKSFIQQIYEKFKVGELTSESQGIEKYSRLSLTKELSDLLHLFS